MLTQLKVQVFRILRHGGLWLIRKAKFEESPAIPSLAGDRDIENSWVLAEIGHGPGEALDFGCGRNSLGLTVARRGYNVTVIDLEPVWWPYIMPNFHFIQGDLFKANFIPQSFDLIINCSTVEHIGLAGRYGITENREDGDLEAMSYLWNITKPNGTMILTIPVGQDAVFAPLHRVYGRERLPRLLERWEVKRKEYWAKDSQNRWILADESTALGWKSSSACYGLGLFVLQRRLD